MRHARPDENPHLVVDGIPRMAEPGDHIQFYRDRMGLAGYVILRWEEIQYICKWGPKTYRPSGDDEQTQLF
jgi:hypothetical protein